MIFLGKSIYDIGENDLLSLISTSREDHDVDFKKSAYPSPPVSELPQDQGERDKVKNNWKVDLCTDVSALANAHGGWIICGMREKKGVATELCGIGTDINAEKEIARLEQAVMSNIEPPILGLKFRAIDLTTSEKEQAIVIYIPHSFTKPHRVRDTSKFHIRRSGRNDEMTIEEIRAAFNFSEGLVTQIKSFRKQRIQALVEHNDEEIPVMLEQGAKLVLHVVPMTILDPTTTVDLSVFQRRYPAEWVRKKDFQLGRFNLQGYVRPDGVERPSSSVNGYTQIYRNGAVEYVRVIRLLNGNLIDMYFIENMALKGLDIALFAQSHFGVQSPTVVMLSLLGGKGFLLIPVDDLQARPFDIDARPMPINSNEVLIPDILIEDYLIDHKITMKPIFDILWNTGGWENSRSYDEDGNWRR